MNILDWLSNPTALNDLGTGLQAGGQFLGAQSRFIYGREQQQATQFQSTQLRQQATRTRRRRSAPPIRPTCRRATSPRARLQWPGRAAPAHRTPRW
jgi:hypothetical protein